VLTLEYVKEKEKYKAWKGPDRGSFQVFFVRIGGITRQFNVPKSEIGKSVKVYASKA
jgi:hypothetical protein